MVCTSFAGYTTASASYSGARQNSVETQSSHECLMNGGFLTCCLQPYDVGCNPYPPLPTNNVVFRVAKSFFLLTHS